ncbi:alpha/beta hydrolase [Rathayibacter sp. VKM Ac-2856]|uniref:alpha/beta hydrolase n=1 Tax=unclassified Rathayibacter TaxID=2609250 RepID=UPI001565944C|nr:MULTISPECIES: alpha/beta hydrolase [unclassified Rathayibacter]NQX04230.1 alpha/beta hydrolase [Rathayibacter sp. VKM Ac-2858]NQX19399.1 alpha/beta hydrolase [Rathayibacter sp. VKM Ac-2856]
MPVNDDEYSKDSVRSWLDDFTIREDAASESDVVAAAREVMVYLRRAVHRPRASLTKLAVTIVTFDVFNRLNRGVAVADSRRTSAAALAVLGIVTRGFSSAEGDPDSDQTIILRECKAHIEKSIGDDSSWREVWSEATRLGGIIGFEFAAETRRGSRLWTQLALLASQETKLLLEKVPEEAIQEIRNAETSFRKTPTSTIIGAFSDPRPGDFELIDDGKHKSPIFTSELDPLDTSDLTTLQHQLNPSAAKRLNVWFGTNRKPLRTKDSQSDFTNTLSHTTSYGVCAVNIPRPEMPVGGILGPYFSTWFRIGSERGAPRLAAVRRFDDRQSFIDAFDGQVSATPDERSCLVFVHGFNTSFKQAAVATAQISWAIKHQGPTAMFSWASRGNVLNYSTDEKTIDKSRENLVEFLETLRTCASIEKIDLIVHSLGNRLVLRAFSDWFSIKKPTSPPLRNLYLGAPDVAVEEFFEGAPVYKAAAEKITMYGSNADTALLVSSAMHRGTLRAGQTPPGKTVVGIDTIETSHVDRSPARHSSVIHEGTVRSDIYYIQAGEYDPAARPNLNQAFSTYSPDYWRFG